MDSDVAVLICMVKWDGGPRSAACSERLQMEAACPRCVPVLPADCPSDTRSDTSTRTPSPSHGVSSSRTPVERLRWHKHYRGSSRMHEHEPSIWGAHAYESTTQASD
ncbi:hypothetical protein EYF80_006922 [Liparis tanakae]|uniref:Uncharacterized protein n=1 Tax=Liparis tanakae TaxID=230148 RepID=A0A4Z2IYA9_9TELE|nr:hypothetical protein EYF80_006922 [Liparis tanakae]